jgi:hypothetical protein
VKRIGMYVMTLLIFILLCSLILYKEITLISFINLSFYVSSLLILFSLLVFVVQKGFFDGVSYGFRKLFKRNNKDRFGSYEQEDEILPLSEMIRISFSPLLISGLILLLFMLIGLWIYSI